MQDLRELPKIRDSWSYLYLEHCVRLRHMLDAAREAVSFVEGRSRQDLTGDRLLLLAVVKEIEIIGEAASQISPETRSETVGNSLAEDNRHAESPDPCILRLRSGCRVGGLDRQPASTDHRTGESLRHARLAPLSPRLVRQSEIAAIPGTRRPVRETAPDWRSLI
jgi:hypothetical protein